MRKVLIVCSSVVLVLAVAAIAIRAQQDKSKRPSPPATAKCELAGGKTVTIDYSSPRKKGRTVFPDVVKYGEVWRTGANEATTFVTTADVMVGGTHVPAGSYTLFTVPGKEKWTLVISKKTGEWGTDYPGEKEDLARVDMKAGTSSTPVENFTISFEKAGNGCNLKLAWDSTTAWVSVGTM
ncbi:MAG TPA: DUF2911 domain-containing protein [Candidatus Dormibacteraeota bacterium]|jgi:hypothetical protein|nr:DUF2911 domain-containing protein [Candidatus Dormibacteraeota bacterium]